MIPLVEELIPCSDPWDIARKLAHLPGLLFLDSADRSTPHGRYSYVMAEPTDREHSTEELTKVAAESQGGVDPFHVLSQLLHRRSDPVDGLPPFQGGLAGLFGYSLSRQIEAIPAPQRDEFRTPAYAVGIYNWVVSFDHQANRAWLVWNDFDRLEARARLLDLLRSRTTPPPRAIKNQVELNPLRVPGSGPRFPSSNFSRDGYIAAVRKAVEYVHAGDIFQVNLSQRLLAPLTEHPLDLYGRLRLVSPAPYACYFDAGDFQIVSASPEQFLQVTAEREVRTRPIKGTRPRGKTPAEDAALLLDLTTNPKDRAENVMIVDLLRNDIGRVCEYGSVTVPRVCEVESYNYVHHLVSEVRGKLRAECTPFDLLRAAFPGGSVTGAPKVRAMEIIAELEPTARGPYCGSIGFIGFDGRMDSNILIRTFTAGRGWLQFPVGGGIVADSDPATEYEETLHKAAGLLRALRV